MSEKAQKSVSSHFICEHCREPIQKNEDLVVGPSRDVVALGSRSKRAFGVYHKNRPECFEASQSEQ